MPRIAFIIILLTICYSCSHPKPTHPVASTAQNAVLGDTIGSVCELIGYTGVHVSAYSLVFGLSGTGSSDCPAFPKEYLIQYLRKGRFGQLGPEYANMTAEEIIESDTTAAVMVEGWVNPGVPKNKPFDVDISIPWGSQTTSLQGGWLLPTELQVVVPGQSTTRPVAGRPTAVATGPIFINPFSISPDNTKVDPRRGVVLGGGRTLYDRQLHLALLIPDSAMAQRIQGRINSRFKKAGETNVALARNRSVITLTIPEEYHDNYQHFIALVMSLYLQDSGAYQELKLKQLNDLAEQPNADFEAIALGWEGIGKNSLKYLEPLYIGNKGKVSFYAARTALNLGDMAAIDPLITIAMDDNHPSRLAALETLHKVVSDIKAKDALTKLLDNPSLRVRILAYEGLRRSQESSVETHTMTAGFNLEVVDTKGDKFICVWANEQPRIILFGKNLYCRKNVFYESPDKSIVINAGEADNFVTISHRLPGRDNYISSKSPLSVKELIVNMASGAASPNQPVTAKKEPNMPGMSDKDKTTGAGLSFSQIVGILYEFCEVDHAIPAKFKIYRLTEELTD